MNINRDLLGKVFFAVAILIGLYMFVCPISHILVHVDEYWTVSLINLPFIEGMRVAVSDVHPPLHYIILYALAPLTHNGIYLLKVTSIIPFFIILAISVTKIRNDYGWLTCGVFAFTIATMSVFFIEFVILRMYSWALLFMILVFIYFKEVMVSFERRSWILLTVFTLLASYTHYFLLFTCGFIYLFILARILRSPDKRQKLKTWIYSVVALAVLYAPWFIVMVRQIGTQSGEAKKHMGLADLFNCITYYSVNSPDFSMEMIALKALAIIFLVTVIALIYKYRAKYEASGVFLMYATTAVGVFVLSLTVQPLRVRYLAAGFGIFWLSVSILLSKVESDKILAVMLAMILVLSFGSVMLTHEDAISKIDWANDRDEFLKTINNDSTVMVYNTNFGYMFIHGGVNKTTEYSLSDTYFFDDNVKITKDIKDILAKHPKDNVYLVNWKDTDKNKKYEKTLNLTECYDSSDVVVLKINQ